MNTQDQTLQQAESAIHNRLHNPHARFDARLAIGGTNADVRFAVTSHGSVLAATVIGDTARSAIGRTVRESFARLENYETSRKSTETVRLDVRSERRKRIPAAKKAVAAVGSVSRY